MTGNHNHFGRIVEFADFSQSIEAVDAGKPDVEQDDVERRLLHHVEASLAAFDGRDGVSLVGENSGEGVANSGFIVNNEDARHAERTRPRRQARKQPATPR